MLITARYASLLALVFIALSVRTLRLRRKLGIAVGDGSSPQMLRAIRVHSNFAEYVPLTLLLIYFSEVQGAYAGFLHVVCLCLLVGRLSHAWGVSHLKEDYRFRVFGMAMTLTATLLTGAYLLLTWIRHLTV